MVTTPTTTNTTTDSVADTEAILKDQVISETDKDRTTANSMEIITVVKVVMVGLDSEGLVSKDLMAMDSMEMKDKELMIINLNLMTLHKMIPNITRKIKTTTTKGITTMDQITMQPPDLLLTPEEKMARVMIY